jgi:transposase
LQAWRLPRPPPGERKRLRSLRLRWLCLRPPSQLKDYERAALAAALAADEQLATGYRLRERFRVLVAERDVEALTAWLDDAQSSQLPSFVGLASGLSADRPAVEAALTTGWSNGPVEGFVHKVKLIKRQGYGRAGIGLLRARVLAA